MGTTDRPRLGVALGGGALRGTAHIGILRALERSGLTPDVIAGASMGAVVAGLYACGWTPDRMEELAVGLELRDLYDPHLHPGTLLRMAGKVVADFLHLPAGLLGQPPRGLIAGERIEALLHRWTGGRRVAECRPRAAFVAVDLLSAERVVFSAGPSGGRRAQRGGGTNGLRTRAPRTFHLEASTVAEAVRASIAIPFVFEPKQLGHRLLVDGGLLDNVPADVVRGMGA
ncbi:MAG TPA: patatin-like phospholipase family protein, partial [Limnochordia bacterium]